MPFGGHKGYAVMVAVELLGRMFTGTDRPTRTRPVAGPDHAGAKA